MSLLANISLITVNAEINACGEFAEAYGWVISPIDEITQRFSVSMTAPKDKEVYEILFQYDNYPEYPFLIDFVDPKTKAIGTLHSYPKSNDSFFHPRGLICHPCSRKSYSGYTGIHMDWQLPGWKSIAGSLTNLNAILDTIFSRISNHNYAGRMAR